jgi:thiamine transporter ThiT
MLAYITGSVNESETLQLMLNHITANVRLPIAGHFRKQDLRRVVNEIARMCKKFARLGCSETSSEIICQSQTKSQGARV